MTRLHNRVMRLLGLGSVEYTLGLYKRAGLPPPRPVLNREALADLAFEFQSGARPATPGLCEAAAEWVGLRVEDLMLPGEQWRARFGDLLTD